MTGIWNRELFSCLLSHVPNEMNDNQSGRKPTTSAREQRRWSRWIGIILISFLILGGVFAAAVLDRMAVGFLTGQRRVPGQDWFGNRIPDQGPPPKYIFLGFSKPSETTPGFVVTRPADDGVKAGLEVGDIVLSVGDQTYASSFDVISALLTQGQTQTGETVQVRVRRGDKEFELEVPLQTFYRTPADLQLPFQEVEFASASGHRLRGWWIPGPSDGDRRAVVFVHGATSSRFQGLEAASHWRHRGYGTLTMDLSGRGTSDGDFVTYTQNERHDVRSMISWLVEKQKMPAARIVVFGTSNGASSSIYALAEGLQPAALALDAPYSDLWAEGQEMIEAQGFSPLLIHALRVPVLWRTGLDIASVKPIDRVAVYRGPVLFIHGDHDSQVLPYHSLALHDKRVEAGLPSRRWVIPGGRHGFDNYPPPQLFWGEIADFFDAAIEDPNLFAGHQR